MAAAFTYLASLGAVGVLFLCGTLLAARHARRARDREQRGLGANVRTGAHVH
jgi:hypothetical protein